MDIPAIIVEPSRTAEAAVIWLHGLGADGHDFEPIVPALNLPSTAAVRFVFPHASHRSVTINNGMRMRAWYDITGSEMSRQEDEAGIRASAASIQTLIDEQRGIPSHRIVLAGFSQGGAIALHAGLRHPSPLAGIIALSTYLPLADRLAEEASPASRETSILMMHGTEDGVIPVFLAERSRRRLSEQGYRVDWHAFAIAHSVTSEEISIISSWLCDRLGLKAAPDRPL